jgi:hypothetical protein
MAIGFGMVVMPDTTWSQQADGQPLYSGRGNPPKGLPIGGMIRADSTFQLFTTDANGALRTVDDTPDREANTSFVLWSGAAGDTTAVGMADSTAIMDTHGLRHLGLMLKAFWTPTATILTLRIAVQVRAHPTASADSVNTYPWAWTNVLNATGATSDTVRVGQNLTPDTVTPSSQELVVVFNQAGGNWTTRSRVYIPLYNNQGTEYWAPFTSIRVRVLGGAGVATLWGTLVGTPL